MGKVKSRNAESQSSSFDLLSYFSYIEKIVTSDTNRHVPELNFAPMKAIELSFEEECACSNDRFCVFVSDHEHFTEEEIRHLKSAILNKKLSRILYVSATLAVWSMIAAWVDAVILPFIIIYTIALPGAQYYPLLFPVVWTIVNATFKFLYIRRRLRDAITFRDNALAVFPYAGAAFLLKSWFIGDPLLRKASLAYIAHQKKLVVNKVLGIFKKNRAKR